MSWFGLWFGGGVAPSSSTSTPPTPIPAPFVSGDPEFVDVVDEAVDRITQQFQGD